MIFDQKSKAERVEIEVLLEKMTDHSLSIRSHEGAKLQTLPRRDIKVTRRSRDPKSVLVVLHMTENRALGFNLL